MMVIALSLIYYTDCRVVEGTVKWYKSDDNKYMNSVFNYFISEKWYTVLTIKC